MWTVYDIHQIISWDPTAKLQRYEEMANLPLTPKMKLGVYSSVNYVQSSDFKFYLHKITENVFILTDKWPVVLWRCIYFYLKSLEMTIPAFQLCPQFGILYVSSWTKLEDILKICGLGVCDSFNCLKNVENLYEIFS